jgi:glycosyltransferase involved in cell wall biosynthesis
MVGDKCSMTKKIRLVIISERTRYHFQKPLEYFKNIEIYHLYKYHYPDMDPQEFGSHLIKYKNIFDLLEKLKALKPDLIQGLEPYYGYSRFKIPVKILPIIIATYFFCRANKIPYFFHVLENILPELKYGNMAGAIMAKIAQIYAHGAKFVFYLNEGAKKNLLKLGLDLNKISYGLWGIWGLDINQFSPPKSDIFDQQKNILFAGRLIEQKGITDLIKAVNIILNQPPKKNIILTIVGDGPLKESLNLKIKNLKLEKYVNFVGQMPNEKLPDYFRKAYLTVSPSRSLHYSAEQIGVTNIEAMACGSPVIATKSGSIPEYVIDKKTGILVSEKNFRDLADAIIKFLKDEKLRKEFSHNCRKYILEKFDAKKNVLLLEDIVLNKLKNE